MTAAVDEIEPTLMMTDSTPVKRETYSLPSGNSFNIELCELIPSQKR